MSFRLAKKLTEFASSIPILKENTQEYSLGRKRNKVEWKLRDAVRHENIKCGKYIQESKWTMIK